MSGFSLAGGTLAILPLGPANTVLWSDGAANQWSGNPIANSFQGLSFIAAGPDPRSSVGTIRMPHSSSIQIRNNLNTADVPVITLGAAANSIDIGGSAAGRLQLTCGGASFFAFIVGASALFVANSTSAQLNANLTSQCETAFVGGARRVVSLCLGAAITATEMPVNTGDEVVFLGNATTAPTANSVGGPILYASGGAAICRGTGGTVTTYGPA